MKTRLIALMIILCILCTGCASETGQQEYWEYSEDGQKFFYNIENVTAFAGSDLAPKGFANPKCLKSIGEYGDYLVLNSDYQSYFYRLVDANGVDNHLWIRHGKNYGASILDDTVLNINEANGTLLTLNHSVKGIIVWDDVIYRYIGGKLFGIYWHIGDIEFSLSVSRSEPYPLDGRRTFITKITSLSEYERTTAIKEFMVDYRLYS